MKLSLTKLIMLAGKAYIYLFIYTVFALQFAIASGVSGQNLEQIKVSVNLANVDLETFLLNIEEQTDLKFSYNIQQLQESEKGNFKYVNKSVKTVLKDVSSKHSLEFHQLNNIISVTKPDKKSSPSVANNAVESILQEVRITGQVLDDAGDPLPGATIRVKGTTIGTITDFEGNFSLLVPENYTVITVSFIGFRPTDVDISANTQVVVKLELDVASLQEVVVIGYGAHTKKEVATSVSTVRAQDIKDQPVVSFDEAIAGKMAGVRVEQTSGAPGSGFNISIRGTGTITAGREPLYVVDGVPLSDRVQGATGTLNAYSDAPINPLNSININDIESISILKDAAAAAIYGSRGANGVVLITTKSGSKGAPKVNIDSYVGFQNVTTKIDMMDAYQYARLKFDGHNNAYLDYLENNGLSGSITDPNSVRTSKGAGSAELKIAPELVPYVNNVPGLTNTDWQDAIFRTGIIQSHTMSVSGGNDRVGYFLSGTYLNQQGVVVSSGYEQYNVRMNLKADYNKVKFGVNFAPSRSVHDRVKAEGPYWADGVIGTALVSSPMFPVYNPDGSYAYGQHLWRGQDGETWSDSYINPVALAELTSNKIFHNRLLGNTYMEWTPIKNLMFRSNFGVDINDFSREYYRPKALPQRNMMISETPGEGRYRTESLINVVFEQTATYKLQLGTDHNFDFLTGVTAQKENQAESYISVRDFPNDFVQTLNAATLVDNVGSQRTSWSLLSYLARVQYNYAYKYFFSASIRSDGSSRFGMNSRWGYFPSMSAAWVVTEESFFNVPAISFLKLRSSYGETGNFSIGNFPWISRFGQSNYVLGLASGGMLTTGVAPTSLGNRDLRWEKTSTIDMGLEVGFFDDKLTFEFDAYQSTTSDMLLNVPVPEVTGFSSALQNIGQVLNQGLEASASLNMTHGNFNWSLGGNFSINRNEVVSLGPEDAPIIIRGGSEGTLYMTSVGNEIGSFYTYVRDGIFTSQEQLDNYPHRPGTKVGDPIILDMNGDGIINEEDRAITGSYFPDYIFGVNARMSYKGIDFSMQVQGVQGNQVMNLNRRYIYNMEGHQNNMTEAAERYVSPENPGNGDTHRALRTVAGNRGLISNWMIEDGSFVRIRNITLGYTLPKKVLEKLHMTNARVYISAQNPFTFTNYTGFNPEVSGSYQGAGALGRGEDYGTYPLARTISMGVNVGF